MMRLALAAALCAGTLILLPPATPRAEDAAEPAARVLQKMGRGINVLGYDGLWEGRLNAPFRQQNFKQIYDAGFRHVRINLHAFQHLNADNKLDQRILYRLEWAFKYAVEAGLVPVVDEHDFSDCQSDPAACAIKLRAFWTQVSQYFADKQPDAVFELMNEPGGDMTSEAWNEIQRELIGIIRKSDPKRTIIVAALNVEEPDVIHKLTLPEDDRNLIATIHYYEPFRFTHQGAKWSAYPNVTADWGSSAEQAKVEDDFARIAAWSKAQRRPIYLGEFGVYDTAPAASRARYLSFVTRLAERQGWAWAYWQFDHDFSVFNTRSQTWNEPILRALIPPEQAGQ